MAWLLYCAVFPNGKRYFGVTGRSLEARIKDHRDNLRNPKLPFHRALKKYDGNVVFRTVVVGEKKQILNLEIESIASFKTMDRRFGYNVSLGGDLSPMLVPEIVERMRATNTGRTLTPEHRALLSAKWKPKPPA